MQTTYTERLLRTFEMCNEVHSFSTPMLPGTRLVKADCPDTPSPTLQRRYRSIVGSIGYLVQMTRCDMAVACGQLSLFLHNPGPAHMAAAELALAYMRGTHDQGLSYGTLAPTTATFWQGVLTAILLLTLTHAAASPDTLCPSTVPLTARVYWQVKLNTSLPAPSPKRTPTSALSLIWFLWLSHGMPLHLPGGEGKLESRSPWQD